MAIFNISNFQRCINRKCDVKFISKTIKIHHYVGFYITARPLIYLSAASPMMKFYVYIIPVEKCSICNVKIIPIRSTLLLIFFGSQDKNVEEMEMRKERCATDSDNFFIFVFISFVVEIG